MSSLVTRNQKLNMANHFLQSIEGNNHYIFLGDHLSTNSLANTLTDSNFDILNDTYSKMVMGKVVTTNDAKPMVRYITYDTIIFDMYDDIDANLSVSDFYTVINAGSYYHLFKCLDNNNGANSSVSPDFGHITGSNTEIYQTSDGYRWKYMYSVSSSIEAKFSSNTYFPVVVNSEVTSTATMGSIDIIKVEDGGKLYNNYITGTFTLDDLRINGNNKIYGVSNTLASSVNGYYTGCLLYISGGDGLGEFRTINDYISNGNGNFIILDDGLNEPTNTSEYEIYPKINIVGDGFETTTAVGRALINAVSSNSVYRIEMLERGRNYQKVNVSVIANSVVGVSNTATIRAIKNPKGGHGFDIASELFSNTVGISVKFSNTESNTIPTNNIFQQIGLLKNPLFSNVEINFSNSYGNFLTGETVYKVNPIMIANDATINTTSTTLMANADFEKQLAVGTLLYLKASNGTSQQIAIVNTIQNSTFISLTTNGSFACTQTTVYIANVSSNSIVLDTNTATQIYLTNVSNIIETGDILIGVTSDAEGVINTVSRGGIEKPFSTFIQTTKYKGELINGSFENNEPIYQNNMSTSNGYLFCSELNGSNITLYVTNSYGVFDVGGTNTIVGNTSGAIAYLNNVYYPELIYGSGEVLYIENIDDIQRQSDQSETINIYLQF